MTDQPMTMTIPVEWWDAYVALQRAVNNAMAPYDYGTHIAHLGMSLSEMNVVAAASVAIYKLTKTEEGK